MSVGESIVTEADNLEDLLEQVRDAVACHFNEGQCPKMFRLNFMGAESAEQLFGERE
jgi:hypothetical protein